jgi:hypothetical protein
MINVVDLRGCLDSWPYDAQKNVRLGRGADGREIILIRQPRGLEQYEVDGHPDGWRNGNQEAAGVGASKRIPSARAANITAEECTEIFQEACTYYCRLIVLFRLKQWMRAERDARQILHLLELAGRHAQHEEDRRQLASWHPHIARLNVVAKAMTFLDKGCYQEAFQTVCNSTEGLEAFVRKEHDQDPEKLGQTLLDAVQGALENRPVFHPHDECFFFRQDDYWTIRYQGRTAFLKSTRGLQCLACLLGAPGREFHVTELLDLGLHPRSVKSFAATTKQYLRSDGNPFFATGLNDLGPILDGRAKLEYRRRLDDLRHELGIAEQFNDPDRAARARDEIDAISQHVASGLGLGGRDRKTSPEAERARCTVTKRIKKAIRKIAEAIPPLGMHLITRTKTGYFCSYKPHPDRAVRWKL